MSKRAIIVGAGYGGMALANLLGKAGYVVEVYEKNQHLGGRIAAVKRDGFLFDLGPSWYLMPEIFEQYYDLFDASATGRLDLLRFSPGYRVFFENKPPADVMGDVSKDRDLFESIERGAGKKLEKYVRRSTRTYNLAVRYFLYNNFERLRDVLHWPIIKYAWMMLPLALQSLDRYVGRVFRDIRLRQLLQYHMVFLGSSPFEAPAIYSLMTHLDFSSGVFYPRKGMLSLVDDMKDLGSKHDITYHLNSEVDKVVVENGQAVGIRLANGSEINADIVISNADIAFSETRLLEPQYQTYPEKYWQKRQPGPGALLISLGVRGPLDNLQHHNLYFVEKWRENFDDIYKNAQVPEHASVYVCNPTKTDPTLAPEGHENLFVLMPIPAGVSLSRDEEESLAERVTGLLSEQMHVPDLGERIVSRHIFGPQSFEAQFNAWQYNAFGGESHKLLQSVIFRTNNQSKKVKNLYYVGAGTLPGIGLPMCLIGAQLTYKKIVGDRRAGPLGRKDFD